MKYNIPYTIFKSLLPIFFAAGCTEADLFTENTNPVPIPKPKPEPEIKAVEIELRTIDDFKTGLSTIENTKSSISYNALVLNDIPTDSLDLITLVNWNKKTASARNVKFQWNDYGIHAKDAKSTYAFEDWENAGNPKIVKSPDGQMPLSVNEHDSLLYVAKDYRLAISRPYVNAGPKAPGYYEIRNIHELRANLSIMRADMEPLTLNLDGDLMIWNADVAALGAMMKLLDDRPEIDLQGSIKLMPAFDSVSIPTEVLQMISKHGGNIVQNGTNAVYLDRYEDYVAMPDVFVGDVYIRTGSADDFSNPENVFPDTLRLTKDSAEFAAEIIKLKPRPSDWRAKQYVLDAGDHKITVKDERVFAHIAQPSVPVMDDYPNPKVRAITNPNYSDIFLNKNSQGWTVGTGHDLSGRVFGYNDGKSTKLRVRNDGTTMPDLAIKHSKVGKKQRVHYFEGVQCNLTMIPVDKYNFPHEHPVLDGLEDRHYNCKFLVSAREVYFVIPNDVARESQSPVGFIEKFEADLKILQYIAGPNNDIKILNRFVNEENLGMIPPNMGSVRWMPYSEYLQL